MKKLKIKDIIILGLMNFALFVGAGNIILPPFIGLQAGTNVFYAAAGFLLTGVGLPVIAAIAMARVGGSLPAIVEPLGKIVGVLLIVVCYLCVGPLGATPRTATVSYDLGLKPFFHTESLLAIYSLIFFAVVTLVSLYPQKLFETVGEFLSPIKVLALLVLVVTVFVLPAGGPGVPQGILAVEPFSYGVSNGYLTMDTLASLVFGLVIVGSIRSRNIETPQLITRYAIYSGLIAGLALIVIYISLFRLGTDSTAIASGATNGAEVLAAYVGYSYGILGNVFLSILITIACLVTAIGLTCSGSSYFSSLTGINYRILVFIFAGLSMLVSNLGLTQLLAISIPAMLVIYPIFIVLIVFSFISAKLKSPAIVAIPVAALAFVFGLADAVKQIGFESSLPSFYSKLPLSAQGLSWLLPALALGIVCTIIDFYFGKREKTVEYDVN